MITPYQKSGGARLAGRDRDDSGLGVRRGKPSLRAKISLLCLIVLKEERNLHLAGQRLACLHFHPIIEIVTVRGRGIGGQADGHVLGGGSGSKTEQEGQPHQQAQAPARAPGERELC